MDLKSDDIFNIDIDPTLLLSYELDKLNLDNIPNDVFDLPEEIPKDLDNLDDENVVKSESEIHGTPDFKEKKALKLFTIEGTACSSEVKTHSKSQNEEKDINGNEEPSSCENLNRLFDKLELSELDENKEELYDCTNIKVELPDSDNEENENPCKIKDLPDFDDHKADLTDSDNEENEDSSKLKERSPVRTQSRAKKNRAQSSVLSKNKSSDESQFNPEALKFLSGSSQIEFNEPDTQTPDQVTIHPSLTPVFTGNESVSSPIQDYFYGDARANAVSSPESGYESSSAQSGSSSPPLFPSSTSFSLDFIPENVDEQNILEFLAENTTDCALTGDTLSCNSDSKDAKGKIIEIINYLKDIPDELNGSSNITFLNDVHVPSVNNTCDLNVKSLPLSYNLVSKNTETPKKLVYKLDDKAKQKLKQFLSVDEFYAAQKRIYKRIYEAPNRNDVKVIYLEDGTDKASEKRTNLHYAVLESRIEDIYCLIEIQKQYKKPLTDINIRDKYGKTALDYAIQNKMTLVVDYLKENTACQSVIV